MIVLQAARLAELFVYMREDLMNRTTASAVARDRSPLHVFPRKVMKGCQRAT